MSFTMKHYRNVYLMTLAAIEGGPPLSQLQSELPHQHFAIFCKTMKQCKKKTLCQKKRKEHNGVTVNGQCVIYVCQTECSFHNLLSLLVLPACQFPSLGVFKRAASLSN